MKLVTYAEKTHLMGDDAADVLLEYARTLALADTTETVTLREIDLHGNEVEATSLLNASTPILVESTNSGLEVPGNEQIVENMRHATAALLDPPAVQPEDRSGDPRPPFDEEL